MLNQKTETYQGVTITVRARRGADVWDEFRVSGKFPRSEDEKNHYRLEKFVEYVTRTVSIEGDLGYEWPTIDSSNEVTQAAYAAWCDMDVSLMIAWANLIYDANQPPLPEENLIPGKT